MVESKGKETEGSGVAGIPRHKPLGIPRQIPGGNGFSIIFWASLSSVLRHAGLTANAGMRRGRCVSFVARARLRRASVLGAIIWR